MCDNPHCGQRRLFIEMAPRNEIVSASLLQSVSPLYSTFQPYIFSTTHEIAWPVRREVNRNDQYVNKGNHHSLLKERFYHFPYCRNWAMERIELIAPYTANTNNSPITTFSHQRLRYCAPMKRALLLIHHNPHANNGNNKTCAMLAITLSVKKYG